MMSERLFFFRLHRIYGDKANQIIDGLKEKPCIAVPIALRRLKSKTQDWKEHQERFNKCWKELNIKNYQKSLCNDASTFKQNDQKDTKTKNLLQEAEAVYHEVGAIFSIFATCDAK